MDNQTITNLQFAMRHFGTRCKFELTYNSDEWVIWLYDRETFSEDPIARVFGDCEYERFDYQGS